NQWLTIEHEQAPIVSGDGENIFAHEWCEDAACEAADPLLLFAEGVSPNEKRRDHSIADGCFGMIESGHDLRGIGHLAPCKLAHFHQQTAVIDDIFGAFGLG